MDCLKDSCRYDSFIRGVYGEDPGDTAGDSSTDDDQESLKSLRCDKSTGIAGRRLDKLQGQLSAIPNKLTSLGEDEMQSLVDAQLSETGASFGVTVEPGHSVGDPEAEGTKATIESVSTTTDGAVDYIKVESSQADSGLTKILDIPEWVPVKSLPGRRNDRKETSYRKSSAKFNTLKVLQDQQAKVIANDKKATLSIDHQADNRQSQSHPLKNTAGRRRCCAYVDLTDDNHLPVHLPRKKKSQAGLFTEAATAESADVHSTPQLSDTTPQTSASQGAGQSPNTETTKGPTIDALHDIQEDVDEEVQIIGTATVHQRRTVRTRTRTVLTYRSRSVSETAAVKNTEKVPHTLSTEADTAL